ncbi:hypothetical protein B0H14DRAFT_3152985 [Mycena olivaceomarginata]|nr:hypothetical protein B0H14DRAFT_3152985 [Mycena olivaceomarginata]
MDGADSTSKARHPQSHAKRTHGLTSHQEPRLRWHRSWGKRLKSGWPHAGTDVRMGELSRASAGADPGSWGKRLKSEWSHAGTDFLHPRPAIRRHIKSRASGGTDPGKLGKEEYVEIGVVPCWNRCGKDPGKLGKEEYVEIGVVPCWNRYSTSKARHPQSHAKRTHGLTSHQEPRLSWQRSREAGASAEQGQTRPGPKQPRIPIQIHKCFHHRAENYPDSPYGLCQYSTWNSAVIHSHNDPLENAGQTPASGQHGSAPAAPTRKTPRSQRPNMELRIEISTASPAGSPVTMDTHLLALKWGEGSLIRVLWDERLEKPVITAQTACECDDIAVLAIYSQLVRKPHSRHHNIATLSPNSDVPLEIRVHIHSLYEKAKPEILHQNQTLEGLIQATTALFTEIWKSAPVLNLDGIRGSMVRREIEGHVMGSPGIRGFGIVVSVPLLAGEYIYELTGLLSVDGNAEHTRLSEIRAADNTVRILFGPLRMLNHDCNPNAEYESITGCELGLIVRTLRSVESGEEITLRYSSDYFDDAGQCPCRTCRPPEPQRLGPLPINKEDQRKAKQLKKLRRNNVNNPLKRKAKAERQHAISSCLNECERN